jgi:hypothetical protein
VSPPGKNVVEIVSGLRLLVLLTPIEMESVTAALNPRESVTANVAVVESATEGVPDKTPDVLREIPVGSVPL